jgi:hypothetical protein
MEAITKSKKYKEETLPVRTEPASPAQLLEMAISKDLDIEKLGKLMELQKSWQMEQARKAFFSALNEFQANAPELRKTKKVSFSTAKGQTEYHYAPLADIVRQIKQACKECGLSYRWTYQDTKDELRVTCIITHIDGHSEETTMSSMPDLSGSKNPIQSRGSSIEYLKRYTLIGALGLSTADSDIDGQVPERSVDELHDEFMNLREKLIAKCPELREKTDPDNWKTERTAKVYIGAIAQMRKLITERL